MYNKEEIIQLIKGGENSSVEFKAPDVKIDSLARKQREIIKRLPLKNWVKSLK